MKKIWIVGLMLCVLGGVPAYAANASDKTIGQDLQKLRKDYQTKVDKDLKAIDHRIKLLKHDARRTENRAKTDLKVQIKGLEKQKKDVDKKFSELKRSTGDAWKDLQKGMDDAVSDLKKAVDQAADSFKK